jgi:hypothetical protein
MSDLINFPIDDLTPEQMQFIQNKLLAKQTYDLFNKLENMQNEFKSLKTDYEILKQTQQNTIEVAANSLRVKQGRFEFINQGDFGRFFSVSLSSVSVGKLLKIVGLAQPSRRGGTVPYRSVVGKYAQVTANGTYSVTQWHYENCMDKIDNWLKDNEYFEQFYSIQDEKELKEFVDELYESIF